MLSPALASRAHSIRMCCAKNRVPGSVFRTGVALAACLAIQVGAQAQHRFQFAVEGSGTQVLDQSVCDKPLGCFFPVGWSGTLTVLTRTDADGVHRGEDLLSFELASNLVDYSLAGTLVLNPPTVTMEDRQVISVNGGGLDNVPFLDPFSRVSFDGLTASFTFGGCQHCGHITARATLMPIPEPGSAILMIAGLSLLVGRLERRRAHAPEATSAWR